MDRLDKIQIDAEIKRVELLMANPGMYRVIGVDRFSNKDWIEGEYKNRDHALLVARSQTRIHMDYASDSSVATVFLAYDDKGDYLGGDIWEEE